MDKYENMDSNTRRAEWRSDRLDRYADYNVKLKIWQHIYEKRLKEGGNPEELLRELLAKMINADQDLGKKLFDLDTMYYKHFIEP